jgi:hypothetical protein
MRFWGQRSRLAKTLEAIFLRNERPLGRSSLRCFGCDARSRPQALNPVKSMRALRLPEKLCRRSRIRRKTVKEPNIGDFCHRKMHSSRVSFNRDLEQNRNCSPLGPIIHLVIANCVNVQSGFFSNFAFQGTLKRFVSSNFASRQRPKSLPNNLPN